jgi:hypothetical protein
MVFLWIAMCCLSVGAAPLVMDFDGGLKITGLDRDQTATSRRPVQFARQGGVVIGPEQALKLFHSGKLNGESGSLVMQLMPLDWTGGNKEFQFFFHCRNRADGSIVMLQNGTDGKLTFLIGFLNKFSKVSVDNSNWKPGQWHLVQVNWTREALEIFLDGKSAGKAPRARYEELNLDGTIDIGGKIFAPCQGETAISYLMLSSEVLPVQTEIPKPEAAMENREPENNIAAARFQAVMLPSSQWVRDRSMSIEQAMDGNPESCYLSGKDDGEHWVEVRWPQPVRVDGVQALARAPQGFTSYAVTVPAGQGWREVLTVQSELEERHGFQPLSTDRIRISFADGGQLALRELYVTGEAPELSLKQPGWPGFFIWYPEPSPNDVVRYFRRNFKVEAGARPTRAMLQICCDDAYTVYINGQFVGSGGFQPELYEVSGLLREGRNTIAVRAQEFSICEGLLAELTLIYPDGRTERIYTDQTWSTSKTVEDGWNNADFDDRSWKNAVRSANLGDYEKNMTYRYFGTDGPGFVMKNMTFDRAGVKPGEPLEIRAVFSSARKAGADYGFRLELGDEALNPSADYSIWTADAMPSGRTSGWEPGRSYEVKWNIVIPAWAPHGSFPLKVRALSNGSEAAVEAALPAVRIARFKDEPVLKNTPLKSGVEERGGQLRMVVNGEIVAPPIFTVNSFNNSFRLLGEGGSIKADLYRLQMMSDHIYPQKSADKEQFYSRKLAMIDQDIRNFLKIYPDARILWAMTFRPEASWNDDYPDEVAVFPDGTRTKNSFASQVWLDMSAEWIQRMVTHMRRSDYAGHIAGFHFGIGDGAEAMYWGRNHNAFDAPRERVSAGDFSPAAMRQFRIWLREKYRGNVAELRRAWKNDRVDFETAAPDMNELRRAEQQNFRDPASGAMSMDYWSFHGDSMADAAVRIAEEYKKACNNELLVGVYGFYNLAQLQLIYRPASSHHVAYTGIERVLNSKAIDYLACIQSYAGVNGGTPVITGMPDASLARHGKIFLEEYDIRTFFTDLTFSHSHTTSQRETLNIIRRDFGETLVRNNQCWFYGFARGQQGRRAIGWYSEQSLIDELNRSHKIGRAVSPYANRSTAEVALFVNARDIVTMDIMDAPGTLINAQYNTVYRELKQLAVPYDCFLLSDFNEKTLAQYKVVIIPNAFFLSEAERSNIRRILEKQRKTVLWLYAPGYSDPDKGLSVANIGALTGINVGMTPEFQETLTVRTGDGGEFGPYRYPFDQRKQQIGPVFHVDDPQAEVLGVYKHNGKPAVARKTVNGMTSIYCAVPVAGRKLLEQIFRQSGIHFYGSQLMYMNASSRFVTVHALRDLNDTLRLPAARSVLNLYTGETVSNTEVLPINLKRGGSSLYFLGNQAEINELKERLNEK